MCTDMLFLHLFEAECFQLISFLVKMPLLWPVELGGAGVPPAQPPITLEVPIALCKIFEKQFGNHRCLPTGGFLRPDAIGRGSFDG